MSVTLKYGKRMLYDAEATMTSAQGANVTCTADSTIRKYGVYSAKQVVAAGATTGIISYYNFSVDQDLTLAGASATITFWVYSTVALSSSDYHLVISETVNGAESGTYVTLNMGAITANTWTQVTVVSNDLTSFNAVKSIGIKQTVDKGAMTIYIDNVEIGSESKTYNELSIKGFDAPDEEEAFPQIEPVQLLDGSWYETPIRTGTRLITLDLGVLTTAADYQFARDWYMQGKDTRQITYDSETLDVVRTENGFRVEWEDDFHKAKRVVMIVREKSARLIYNKPSSWTN